MIAALAGGQDLAVPVGCGNFAPPRVLMGRLEALADELERPDHPWLGAGERTRLTAITSQRRREQFLAGRILARRLLCDALGGCAADWPLSVNAHGKPTLPNRPDIHVSITHSGPFVACAVGNAELGLDVELIEPRRHTEDLIRMTCNAAELAQLDDLRDSERALHFIGIWTVKEAALKQSGEAFSVAQLSRIRWRFAQAADATITSWYFGNQRMVLSLASREAAHAQLELPPACTSTGIEWRVLEEAL